MAKFGKDIDPKVGAAHTFDKKPQNINRTGKNRSLTTILKKKLFDDDSYMTLKGAEVLDDKGKPTGDKINVRVKLNNAEALMVHYIKRASKSDSILKDVIDRIDGKANQNVNFRDITAGKDVEEQWEED